MNNISLHSILNEMVSSITEAGENLTDNINTAQIMRDVKDQKEAEQMARSLENSDKLEAQRMANAQVAQAVRDGEVAARARAAMNADSDLNPVQTAYYVGKQKLSDFGNNVNSDIDIAQMDAANAANDGSATLGQTLLHKAGGLVDWAQENPGLALGGATAAALAGGAGALALRKKLAAQKRG